jgi:hypothetical protein
MTSQPLIDAKQRLLDVRNAISRILRGAQTARYDGREVRYADLAGLRELEKQYIQDVAAESKKAQGKPRNRINYMSI